MCAPCLVLRTFELEALPLPELDSLELCGCEWSRCQSDVFVVRKRTVYVSDYIMACKLTFELLLPLDELPLDELPLPLDELPLPLDELPLPLDELFDPLFPFPPPSSRSITSDLSKLRTR